LCLELCVVYVQQCLEEMCDAIAGWQAAATIKISLNTPILVSVSHEAREHD
jgi:hypothetical protein